MSFASEGFHRVRRATTLAHLSQIVDTPVVEAIRMPGRLVRWFYRMWTDAGLCYECLCSDDGAIASRRAVRHALHDRST